jgi:hypothetical protein
MQAFWVYVQHHSRSILVAPVIIGIGLVFLTGHTFFLGIGAVWFLGGMAVLVGAETFHSVHAKLPWRKRDALVSFLQYGGYSIAAASMGLYFALAFWTSYHPRWLVLVMFVGILMFFSSGFAYKARPRRKANQKNDSGLSPG